MKTFLKVVGIVCLTIVALAGVAFAWLTLHIPNQRPASNERFEATPVRLARGAYLVNHVTDCLGCHSEHTFTYGFPIKPGREGAGGIVWDDKMGFPGVVAAANLTPDRDTGLGKWSDDEILRAIREGVDRDGKALFPIMPYAHLRNLSDEDGKSIVVYLRTLKPIRYERPAKKLQFPLNFIEKFVPAPITAEVKAPERSNTVAYGRYLTQIGGCYECHTPHDKKGPVEAMAFSGGWEMKGIWGRNVTANITPHPTTWVGRASREEFIARFRAMAAINAQNAPMPQKGRNTIMPWLALSGATDEDLGAIYDYLKTVPPIENHVNSFPDAG